MPASSTHSREILLSIQVLRALAALGVVIAHIVGYEFVHQHNLPAALPSFPLGNVGVDVFFVISGFVMVYSSEKLFQRANAPREFLMRRVVRIVPLYWLTTTIVLAYLLVRYRDLSQVNFSWTAVVGSYLFIPIPQNDGFMAPVHGVGWTLNYEMFFYACFCFALPFAQRTGVALLTLALCMLVAFNQVSPLPGPFGYWTQPIILEFVLGMLIALAFRSDVRIPHAVAIPALLLALTWVAGSAHWSELPRIIAWGVPSALIVAALVLSQNTAKPGPVNRALSFLGDASYSLYLVHPLAITLPRRFFPDLVSPSQSPWLYAALLLALSVGAAVLVHILIERPITRALQRRIASSAVNLKLPSFRGKARWGASNSKPH